MTHLTLTGYHAGRPLCDCDKAAELARGARFIHAVYCPPFIRDDPAECCPQCKAEYDAAEPDGEDNA